MFAFIEQTINISIIRICLMKKENDMLKSFITKVFIVGICFNLMYSLILGLSGMPIKNALGFSTTLNAQIKHKRATLPRVNIKEDSATIYYNLGWDSYKKSNFNDARYYWERGSFSLKPSPDKFNCLFRLGLLQQVGEGVEINLQAAFNFYMKASNNGKPGGNVDATKNIGTFYENGMFVVKDNVKALEWYLKAKAQGNVYCDEDIARVKKNIADSTPIIK